MLRKLPRWLWVAPLAAYLLYFQGLSTAGLMGPDEPRYSAIGRQMAWSGDWVTPRLWGQPWFEKSPLLYWMSAAGYRLGWGPELAPRLPVALLAVAFLAFYWWILEREFGCLAASMATWILGTGAAWVGFGFAGVTDLPLAATFSAAMLLALPWIGRGDRRWLPLTAALLGVALLGKYGVAAVLAAPLAVRWRSLADFLRPRVVGVFLFVAVPWYLLCYLRNGSAFVKVAWEHQFGRFTTGALGHAQHWWYYLPVLAGLLLPWTPLVGLLAVSLAKSLVSVLSHRPLPHGRGSDPSRDPLPGHETSPAARLGAISKPLADARGSDQSHDPLPGHETSPAARLGAIPKPLADARGSDPSRDPWPGHETSPAARLGAIAKPLADARGSDQSHDPLPGHETGPTAARFGAIPKPLADARGSDPSRDPSPGHGTSPSARLGAIPKPVADARGSDPSRDPLPGHETSPPAARFGAIAKSLADARGSDQSRDREGVVGNSWLGHGDLRRVFLLVWVAFGLVFFSLSVNKLPGYVLPLCPPLAALMGIALAEARSARGWLVACALLLVTLPIAVPLIPAALAEGLRRAPHPAFQWWWLLPALVAVPVWILETRRLRLAATAVVALAATAGAVYVKLAALPQADRLASARPLWRAMESRPTDVCVEHLRNDFVYGLGYYAGLPLPACATDARALHVVEPPGEPPRLVVPIQ